jgi:hypothetical protein
VEDWPPSPAIFDDKTTAQILNGIPVSSVQILTEIDNKVAVTGKKISKYHATRKIYMVRKEVTNMYMSFRFMDHTLLLTADTD